MARGSELTTHQVRDAIAYNRTHHTAPLSVLQAALGMVPGGSVDEAFVRAVADWQENHIGAGAGDGKIGPKTEAHLNIQHPKATAAVARALAIQAAGSILFDSWGNDVRDNNNDGVVDDRNEQTDGWCALLWDLSVICRRRRDLHRARMGTQSDPQGPEEQVGARSIPLSSLCGRRVARL